MPTTSPGALSRVRRYLERDLWTVDVSAYTRVRRMAVSVLRVLVVLVGALTDPQLFSGIGNAYSDEILHAARLSPVALTQRLSDDEVERLYAASVRVLQDWTERLRSEAHGEFPEGVTAFREDFAVHGRFRKRCPVCQTEIQRIRYASNETNYCPRCQTGGRILADRSLSRLLKDDWPRSIEELESRN